MYKSNSIEELVGKTFDKVFESGDELVFQSESGKSYKFYHEQDCCESVEINDITGDLEDLIGTPILVASEDSSIDEDVLDKEKYPNYTPDSHTWTFYNFRTIKGSVTVRWLGESNGYYSESVNFTEI